MRVRDEMLTIPEAAMALGVGYSVAWRLLLTRQLRGVRRGARWYVQRADVDGLREMRVPTPAGGAR